MRLLSLLLIALLVSLPLAGCGGSKSKSVEPEKGSLLRTYKLLDDMGRESGTLTLNPHGGAELRDADGQVIGTFAPAGDAPAEETASTENPAAKKEVETTDEDEKKGDEEK